MAERIVLTHGHMFCGDGGGAEGFNAANIRVGSVDATFRCVGGIDVDPIAVADFSRFAGVPGTMLDLFSREQYTAFHGQEPPKGWTEVTPAMVEAVFGPTMDMVFMSAPCKGFSGLQSKARAESNRYQALNGLTLRGVQLILAAYESNPVPLIVFENVPLIAAQRGRALLDDIRHELEMAGYAVAETTHDCGELGGLAQHRRRFLLVARHRALVHPFVYVPRSQRVRGIGEVLGEMPMPDATAAGPMHRCPRLTWRTWLRLALIPAGKDWRALRDLDAGALRLVEQTDWHRDSHGVKAWGSPSSTVTTEARPSNGAYSVGDPRFGVSDVPANYANLCRIEGWQDPAHTVTGATRPAGGALSVADVRIDSTHTYGSYRVVPWSDPSATITAQSAPGGGGYTVADVRGEGTRHNNVYRIVRWDEPSAAVTAGGGPSSGGLAVGDVRVAAKEQSDQFTTAGHYGVLDWRAPSGAVTSSGQHDNSAASVADPRALPLDEQPDPYPVIIALDSTWHRPLTTLELAALQSYDWRELMVAPLSGESHTGWRQHIGNRVPPAASRAIAEVFGEALIRHRLQEGFRLDTREIWVRRLIAAVDPRVTG